VEKELSGERSWAPVRARDGEADAERGEENESYIDRGKKDPRSCSGRKSAAAGSSGSENFII
jgi:hypothetical protein